jgi:hypothetical protein
MSCLLVSRQCPYGCLSFKIKSLLYFVTDEYTKISMNQNVRLLVFQTWDLGTHCQKKYMNKVNFRWNYMTINAW